MLVCCVFVFDLVGQQCERAISQHANAMLHFRPLNDFLLHTTETPRSMSSLISCFYLYFSRKINELNFFLTFPIITPLKQYFGAFSCGRLPPSVLQDGNQPPYITDMKSIRTWISRGSEVKRTLGMHFRLPHLYKRLIQTQILVFIT